MAALILLIWRFGPLELSVPVNRCICADIPFTELKRLADTGIRDLEELGRLTNCGKGCGMCLPYIRVMLATGQIDLPVLTDSQIDQFLASRSPS